MTNYAKGYQRENKLKHELEKAGYLVFRSAGSHSFADLVAITPIKKCYKPDHFAIRFIQVKVDSGLKKDEVVPQVADTIIGQVNVEFHRFAGRKKHEVNLQNPYLSPKQRGSPHRARNGKQNKRSRTSR